MKYLLIALGILSAFPSFADKKKSKTAQKAKTTSVANTRTNQDATDDGSGQSKNNSESSHLPATRVGASLIQFMVHEWNGKEFTNEMLMAKTPLIVMLYNPGCEHCQELCKKLMDNRDVLKDVEFLLISGVDTKPAVNEFMNTVGITESDPKIHVTLAERDVTDLIFEAKGIPQLMIYNRERILQKVFYSEASIEEIVSLLNK